MKEIQLDYDMLHLRLRDFSQFVEKKSGKPLREFRSHPYIREKEGYKDPLRGNSFKELSYLRWKESTFGKGKILKSVISAIEMEDNNILFWQDRKGPGTREHIRLTRLVDREDKLRRFERETYRFFHDQCDDREYFDYLTKIVGRRYPLIAYIFFIKNPEIYLPLRPTYFDDLFSDLNIPLKTNGKCSWENYQSFLWVISEIRYFLSAELECDITLLDAHSFCWILANQMSDKDKKAGGLSLKVATAEGKKEKEAQARARIGPGPYRRDLIRLWGGRCSISEYENTDFLIASHIKPWRDCDKKESLDPNNGLLLTPNYDRAFDKGLITFGDDGEIVVSNKLACEDLISLGIKNKARIRLQLTEAQRRYLKYHRTRIADE